MDYPSIISLQIVLIYFGTLLVLVRLSTARQPEMVLLQGHVWHAKSYDEEDGADIPSLTKTVARDSDSAL